MHKNKEMIVVIAITIIIIVTTFVILKFNKKQDIQENQNTLTIAEAIEKGEVYKTIYKINKYNDTTNQIREYMDDFEITCTSYLGIEIEDKEGYLEGESTSKLPIPVEESIYLEGRTYTKTYIVTGEGAEAKFYDIKFYKSGDDLVAEFIKQ